MDTRTYICSRTRDPQAIGAVFAVIALLFSTIWCGVWFGLINQEKLDVLLGLPILAIVVNAYLWAVGVWSRFVPEGDSMSYRTGIKLGALIGGGSYITVGPMMLLALSITKGDFVTFGTPVMDIVLMAVVASVLAAWLTLGIPFIQAKILTPPCCSHLKLNFIRYHKSG